MIAARDSAANGPVQVHELGDIVLHIPSGSPAETNLPVIAARLEGMQAALVTLFGRDGQAGGPIHVHVEDVEPQDPDTFGQLHITYRADTPIEAVERPVLASLLGAPANLPSGHSILLDGLLGYIEALRANRDRAEIDAAVSAELHGREPGAALSDDDPGARPLYVRSATSFVAFLLAVHGADRLRQCVVRARDSTAEEAVESVYGKPLVVLETEWRAHLDRTGRMLGSATNLLSWLLSFVRPYWALVVLILVSVIVGLAWYVVAPQIYRVLINDALVHGNEHLVVRLAILLALTAGVSFVGALAAGSLSARLGARVARDMRLAAFEHLQRLSLDYYRRMEIGNITARFSPGLETVESALTQTFPRAISLALQITIALGLLFVVEWHLALLCLILCPVIYAVPRIVGPRSRKASQERQEDATRLASLIHDQTAAQPVVKAFNLQGTLLQRFAQETSQLAGSSFRLGYLSSLLEGITGLSARLFQALLVGIGSVLIVRGYFTMGALYTFYLYLQYAIEGLLALAALAQPIQQAASAMHRVQELLEELPHVSDAPGARPLPRLAGEIRFDGVTFSYTGEQANLNGLSLVFPAGTYVAVVGPSGCGKSTLLNLLMRFDDPGSGSVTIDGHDLRHGTQESLRAQISAVFQEPLLLNTSVRENIRLGRLDATDGEIEDAARAAQIHDFITGLPHGYDTPIGERGGHLSGGQRQRLAIARAIVRRPALLLLDEATSALDSQTEAAINQMLVRMARECTIIAVTHRLSAATEADHICVLDRGRLAEEGTHVELIERQGLYALLFKSQVEAGAVLDTQTLGDRLERVGMIRDLDAETRRALAARFVSEQWEANQVVCAEGDPADRFYLVAEGQLEVTTTGRSGDELVVAVLRNGDHFGEMAFRPDGLRQATVRTASPTVLLALEQEHILEAVGSAFTLPSRERGLLFWIRQQGDVGLEEAIAHAGTDGPVAHMALERLVDQGFIESFQADGQAGYRMRQVSGRPDQSSEAPRQTAASVR